ncbi:MAG: hypothetical protein WBZ51_19245 [Xanthobacteraceae bacterium]
MNRVGGSDFVVSQWRESIGTIGGMGPGPYGPYAAFAVRAKE